MSYRVVYTENFLQDLRDHADWLRHQKVAEHVIDNWYAKLFDKLDSLDIWPETFAVSERFSRITGRTTHKLNFGDYLIFYHVDSERSRVELVSFFNGAKDW